MTKYRKNLRLPKYANVYWENQLQEFADRFDVDRVEYGKQDIRGTESITFFDDRGCVPAQIHFPDKISLLHYVQGYNEAIANFSSLAQFKKEGGR